jgi:hypothetical protein
MGYVKQGFNDGDVLNASQLIKIEQGIQDNETEIAKKAERVVFPMHATAGGNGMYALKFDEGKTYHDVQAALLAEKEVIVQINGNSVFMNGAILSLPFSGITANGIIGFSYTITDEAKIRVISVGLEESDSILIEKSPITSIDDGTEVKY